MDVAYRLRAYIEEIGMSARQFEKTCGFANGWVGDLKSSIKLNSISVIHRNFPDLNIEWLLTGDGSMLNIRGEEDGIDVNSIPVLPFAAVAGYMSDNNRHDFSTALERCTIPEFKSRGADCLIRVDGDSMEPKFRSGDMLAIRIINDPSFFQWGRVYVLNTSQGCVVKKLFPCKEDDSRIICHSENSENYPDYAIPKEDVLSVAIVVGHAGVE